MKPSLAFIIFILLASTAFPLVGYWLDWRFRKKGRRIIEDAKKKGLLGKTGKDNA